jgi:cobalt-zinc-cadmium efflux system outer membrane protein
LIFLFGFVYLSFNSLSQSAVSLATLENLLIQGNLKLLVEKYNISIAEAEIIQAKIWSQPYVSGELNFINPEQNRFVDIGQSGQKVLAVEQLIFLGGKKKNEVEFATNQKELAILHYEKLLRELKFELHVSYYELFFNQKKLRNIEFQLKNIDSLIESYRIQSTKGNIALKDVVRLESFALSLKSERSEIEKSNIEVISDIKMLTGIASDFTLEDVLIDNLVTKPIIDKKESLFEIAKQNNVLYQLKQQEIISGNNYIKWQKSMNIPDLTIGLSYDQRGGAFRNQTNLTFGIPIPLWNKNKGNIISAQYMLEQTKTNIAELERELFLQIDNELSILNLYQKQLNELQGANDNFKMVYNGMLENFRKRNVSLIEFTDFMESYNQSILYVDEVKKQIAYHGSKLNHLISQSIFK